MARPTINLDLTLLSQMYTGGFSIEEIAEKVGVCNETVRNRLKEAGVCLRPAYGRKLNRVVCAKGHPLTGRNRYESRTGRVICRQCRNDQAKKQYKRIRDYQLRCAKDNPELYEMKTLRTRLKRAGISLSEYQTQFEGQNGVCALCKLPETEIFRGKLKLLAVDHDHTTGNRRGLLCRRCNCILGMFNDDPVLFLRAIEYLNLWKACPNDQIVCSEDNDKLC